MPEPEEKAPKAGSFPLGVLTATLILTLALVAGLSWAAWRSHEDLENFENQDMHLEELHGATVHLDEFLAMSALLRIQTGDPYWEQLYLENAAILSDTKDEIARLATGIIPGETTAKVHDTGHLLVGIEQEAMAMSAAGAVESAQARLSSTEYLDLRAQNEQAEEEFIAALNGHVDSVKDAQGRRELWTLVAALIMIPFLFLAWFYTLRMMRRFLAEQRRAEQNLRASEEKYRLLIENIDEVTYMVDTKTDPLAGNLIFVSGQVEKITGVPPDHFISNPQKWFELLHPDDIAVVTESTRAIIKEKRKTTRTYRMKNRETGDYVWLEDDVVPQLDEQGDVTAFFGVARDITSRKQTEEIILNIASGVSAETGESFFRSLVEQLGRALQADYAFVGELKENQTTSIQTIETFAHGQLVENLEYDLADAPCEDVIRGGLCAYARDIQKLYPKDHLLVEMGIEGYVGAPLRDSNEKPLGILVVLFEQPVANISLCESVMRIYAVRASAEMERVQSEAARRESEERYRTLFEESRDAVFMISRDNRFLEINPAGIEMLGYTKEEMLELDLARDLYADADDRDDYLEKLAQDGFVEDYEILLRCKDGTLKIFSITSSLTHGDEGNITGNWGIGRDVTLQKRLEQQLIQSQKMESIGRLAGGVAHDFNNMLTAIKGYTDLTLLELPPESPALENIYEVSKSTDRAIAVTRQLLYFSRRSQLDLKILDINTVVLDMLNMLGHLIGEQHRITTDLEDGLPSLIADPAHIEQVVVNLVLNARDAMQDGGAIHLKTGNMVINEERMINHPGARLGEFVCLTVSDSGYGMDDETRKKIFEPFFSTKDAGRGTGLGLSVAYGIAEQHGGWIEVESKPGRGSTFKVCLPVAAAEPDGVADENKEVRDTRGQGEKILVVEDEEGVRNLVKSMLRQNGYDILTAGDAREALEIYEKEGGTVQLVFSDVVLPGESGVMLVERLRKDNPELPVLLASGYHDEDSRQMIAERGYRFLQKPYALHELTRTIRELLTEKRS